MLIFVFFIFGLIVGSFLNVVIYRLASGEGGIIDGRSHCRDCQHALTWYDNVPLFSFLFLRGKCRYCQHAIAWQYPLVEFSTGMLFALAAMATLTPALTASVLVAAMAVSFVFAAMLVICVYDLKFMEVPMLAVWLSVGVLITNMILQFSTGMIDVRTVGGYIIAGALSFLFFFSLSYFSGEQWMGYGDGYIALVIGLLLGPLWAFVALLIAVWSGSMIGVGMTIVQRKTMKSAIPFGPFLIGGMYVAFAMMHFTPHAVDFLRL